MTQLYPTDYNYTFCNTSILGEYVVNGFGNPDGVQTSFNYNFIVTPAGYEVSLSNTIIMFFIVGILVIVTIFMYWFGLTNKNKPLKMFFLSLSVLMTVFIIGYILSIANTSIGQFSQLTGVINSIYILGTILLAAASIAVIVYVIKFGFEQFYKSKGYEFGEIDVG
jgi:magnesium-transporting ATPase (P-type)